MDKIFTVQAGGDIKELLRNALRADGGDQASGGFRVLGRGVQLSRLRGLLLSCFVVVAVFFLPRLCIFNFMSVLVDSFAAQSCILCGQDKFCFF